MTIAHQISKLLIFLIIGFGILDLIPNGLKETPRISYLLFNGLILISYFASKERSKILDYGLILLVLISSIGFTNFIIDVSYKPTILAFNCQGHHATSFHWFKGFVYGPIVTAIISTAYFVKKQSKTILDNLFSILCITILIFSAFKTDISLKINDQINQTSVPILVLPEDCF